MSLETSLQQHHLRHLRERAAEFRDQCQHAIVRNDAFFIGRYSGMLTGLALGAGDPLIAVMADEISAQVHAWLKTQSEQAEHVGDAD